MENDKLGDMAKMTLDSFVNSIYDGVIKENSIQFSSQEREVFKAGFYECLKMFGNGTVTTKKNETDIAK